MSVQELKDEDSESGTGASLPHSPETVQHKDTQHDMEGSSNKQMSMWVEYFYLFTQLICLINETVYYKFSKLYLLMKK